MAQQSAEDLVSVWTFSKSIDDIGRRMRRVPLPPRRKVTVVRSGRVVEVTEAYAVKVPIPCRTRSAKPVRKASASLRARRMVRYLCQGNGAVGTTYFFTGTFADDVEDFDEAVRRWGVFRRLLLSEFQDMRYVAVPELQKRRCYRTGKLVWHFHAMLAGLPEVSAFREAYGRELDSRGFNSYVWTRKFTRWWTEANGGQRVHRAEIQVARSLGGVCGYLVKYLCKEVGGTVEAGRRNYFAGGRGLVRPLVLEGIDNVPDNEPVYETSYKGRDGNSCRFRRFVLDEPVSGVGVVND